MKAIFLITFIMLSGLQLCSSKNQTSTALKSAVQKENFENKSSKLSELDFLVGHWSGPGISYGQDGQKTHYYDTELVRFDLSKKLLLINARGEQPNGETSYALHTVIYYDDVAGHYWYTPYNGQGRGIPARSFSCNLVQAQFVCYNDGRDFRLIFQRLEDGRWNEYGERLSGENWSKSFETILSPVNN